MFFSNPRRKNRLGASIIHKNNFPHFAFRERRERTFRERTFRAEDLKSDMEISEMLTRIISFLLFYI